MRATSRRLFGAHHGVCMAGSYDHASAGHASATLFTCA